ncbi:MAG: hypothetical protein OXT67_03735 [Zetaproteobacteria bacterium]|nr:hypothetical protein [Zetaproteobacteria bacterium]
MSIVATKRLESGPLPSAGVIAAEDTWMSKRSSNLCANCSNESVKCKRREFSLQAYTVLLLWQEMSPAAVDQPICEECYDELRDVLIDRRDEIEVAAGQAETAQVVRQKMGSLAS